MLTANRYHDISCGHRVVGHEGKCRHLHGHNYRVHFHCAADKLDEVGRVIDFGIIKERLCQWLEDNWDHKFLAWKRDNLLCEAFICLPGNIAYEDKDAFQSSFVWVPFNPTAENMAQYLLDVVGPAKLNGTGVRLIRVSIEETSKCSVTCGVYDAR